MRILLAEDDPQLGDGLMVGLRQKGYAVDWVRDGVAADLALQNGEYALLLLDLGLPRLEGMSVLGRLRSRQQGLPVLVLTARDALPDIVAGLDGGADDYMVKPVDMDELAARIRALNRRRRSREGKPDPLLRHGDICLDPAAHTVSRNGQLISLSALEFSLLHTLLQNVGRVLTRPQLEAAIYGWDDEPDSNVLEVHIHHLRRKLGGELIRTLRGVGYLIARLDDA